MKNLVKKIQHVANLHNLWARDFKILVGVSGGPDSVCLLDILARIKEKTNLSLNIAHVNYCLRGDDSDEDEILVRKLSEKYQIGLNLFKTGEVRNKNINEENLRNIRYDFFERTRKKLNYDFIAVAHNQDDQVETFLMRIIRGAGLQGLSGMKYKSGKIIRPLLNFSRKDILEYLKNNKLEYRFDKTNRENFFLRNKIRNKLIPYLEKNFNSSIKKTISDFMISISEDFSLISELSEKNFQKVKDLRVSEIIKLHPSLQRRLILKEIESKKGNLRDIGSSHIEEIIKIIKSVKNKNQKFLFQGLKLTRKGDKLDLLN